MELANASGWLFICDVPSSFSSTFSSAAAAPPEAAPPAAGAPAPDPPDGTDANLLEPSEINYPHISHLVPCVTHSDGAYFLEILALELRDEGVKTLIISLNADGFENALDILSGRRILSTEGEEEVCCEMLHFDSCEKVLAPHHRERMPQQEGIEKDIHVVLFLGNRRINRFNCTGRD